MNILSYLVAIAILFVVLKLISIPIRIIIRFIINSIIGGIVLWALSYFGIAIPVTKLTIVLTGLFGIPGLVIATILIMFII